MNISFNPYSNPSGKRMEKFVFSYFVDELKENVNDLAEVSEKVPASVTSWDSL